MLTPSRVVRVNWLVAAVCLTAALLLGALVASAAEVAKKEADSGGAKIDGREIFNREWLANDKRSHGGDGLGPVFNDTSCVACHNQGGVGGGGAASKNVTLSTPFLFRPVQGQMRAPELDNPFVFLMRSVFGDAPPAQPKELSDAETKAKLAKQAKKDRDALAKIHPSLGTARSIVVHRFGTSPEYARWSGRLTGNGGFQQFQSGVIFSQVAPPVAAIAPLAETAPEPIPAQAEQTIEEQPDVGAPQVPQSNFVQAFGADNVIQVHLSQAQMGRFNQNQQSQVGDFLFVSSQRNTTALFGIGQLDKIPDSVLVEAAKAKHEGFPEVTGRVNRLKSGKIGRFGWKAQEASVSDFVLTACAVELGLNVPDRSQAPDPQRPDYKPTGLDLTADECRALIDYVSLLPTPTARDGATDQEKDFLKQGKQLFATTGCAACHKPDLGTVSNVYSDLLLHDMGPSLSDSASYGGFLPNSPESEDETIPLVNVAVQQIEGTVGTLQQPDEKTVGPLRQEWRTPPLWGVRDSAPYMHDGRADTIEQAIAFHDGEAKNIARKFFSLKHEEQQQVIAFLKSLQAPQ